MDMGSISAAISAIKTAADLAKLNDSGISLEKAEVKLKLVNPLLVSCKRKHKLISPS